ncbi:MAG: divalent cation transporter [Acidimicrobiia bacterium]|nr:MAG: divalent cation transporter [Acidimicrobiia bacterium]
MRDDRRTAEHDASFAIRSIPRALTQRARSLLGTATETRHSLVALGFNSTTSFVAGVVLGSITGTFERYPGLLIMVPAAIGLRGNISTAFGNRLSTSIHLGLFRLSLRRDSLLVQNLEASFLLSAGLSLVVAAVAKLGALALGLDILPVPTLALISITAGLMSSVVVHVITVVLSWAAARNGWDLDNVVAPVDSTFGDVLTLPALWVAAHLVEVPGHTALAWVSVLLAVGATWQGLAAKRPIVREVCRQAWPILTVAIGVQALAGLVLEQRLAELAELPALLVLQPAFVSSAGALGGILSSRLATKLHVGVVTPSALPDRVVRADAGLLVGLAAVVFAYDGVGAYVAARAAGLAAPHLLELTLLSFTAGLVAVAFVMLVAYYSTAAAHRFNLDPDIYGIPAVTSSVDFFGSMVLVALASAFVLP